MSNDKINNIDRSVIEAMSVETLQGLLQDDFDNADGILDEETRLFVIETLTRKEKDQGLKIPEAEASLEEFKREYLPYVKGISIYDDESECTDNIVELPKKQNKFRKPAIRIIAAIVAVMVLGTATASAMGFNIWRSIVDWTKETLGFSEQADDNAEIPSQLQSLKDEMGAYCVSYDGLLPTYLPEGYAEMSMQCLEMDNFVVLLCQLSDGENTISLQYRIYSGNDNSVAYQKDEGIPEEYIVGGITHYFSSNEGKFRCIWINENVECSISGVDSRDELIRIINSIYGE